MMGRPSFVQLGEPLVQVFVTFQIPIYATKLEHGREV